MWWWESRSDLKSTSLKSILRIFWKYSLGEISPKFEKRGLGVLGFHIYWEKEGERREKDGVEKRRGGSEKHGPLPLISPSCHTLYILLRWTNSGWIFLNKFLNCTLRERIFKHLKKTDLKKYLFCGDFSGFHWICFGSFSGLWMDSNMEPSIFWSTYWSGWKEIIKAAWILNEKSKLRIHRWILYFVTT